MESAAVARRIWAAVLMIVGIVGCGAVLGGCGGGNATPKAAAPSAPVTFYSGQPTPTSTVAHTTTVATLGPQQVQMQTGPFLAPATTTVLGSPVDGILCQSLPQLAYRAVVRLQVDDHGHSRALPGGIGMLRPQPHPQPGGLTYTASTCSYWLHTRAADGVIFVQSPRQKRFTLGDFFAVWDQPLSAHEVAGLQGAVTVTVNDKRWHGAPGAVPLVDHDDIEIAVGHPVPRMRATDWFAAGL